MSIRVDPSRPDSESYARAPAHRQIYEYVEEAPDNSDPVAAAARAAAAGGGSSDDGGGGGGGDDDTAGGGGSDGGEGDAAAGRGGVGGGGSGGGVGGPRRARLWRHRRAVYDRGDRYDPAQQRQRPEPFAGGIAPAGEAPPGGPPALAFESR